MILISNNCLDALFYQQIVLFQSIYQCCMAALIYVYIVRRRRVIRPPTQLDEEQHEHKFISDSKTMMMHRRRSQYSLPIDSYLFGWGIVVPIAFSMPYFILYNLNIQNKAIRMSTGSSVFIVFFRCIQAMYYTAPHTVECNIRTYILYYTTTLHFHWNPSTHQRRRITNRELFSNTCYFVRTWLLLSISMSFAVHYKFQPFSSPIQDIQNFHFNSDIFHIGHIANMYLAAILLFLTVSFKFEITRVAEQLKGYYTDPIFTNPMFTSRTASDFWSRKWNNVVHTILKYGAFYPAQQFMSKRMALFFTFMVSGFMHEYFRSILFYQHPDDNPETSYYVPTLFKLTAFFAWNGMALLLERPMTPYLQPIASKLPTIVVSTWLVLLVIPVSHWFFGDWIIGGIFYDISHGLFQVKAIVNR
jgi:Membrane bound O-acyl transferase family